MGKDANLPLLTGESVDDKQLATVEEKPSRALADFRAGAMTCDVERMQLALAEYGERRQAFRKWLLSQLVEGTHYGYPPGTEPKQDQQGNYLVSFLNKKKGEWVTKAYPPEQWTPKQSFYKAGADFVVDLMGVRCEYEADLDGWKQLGEEKGTFVYKCVVKSKQTGETLGEGRGASKVGAKGADENNAVKMAKKRAKVDAVLETYGLADLFTQDLEDLNQGNQVEHPNPNPDESAPTNRPRGDRVSKDQVAGYAGMWKSKHPKKPNESKEEYDARWIAWARDATGRGEEFNPMRWIEWSPDDLDAVHSRLQ